MRTHDDVSLRTAEGLAQAIARRELSPLDALETTLERIRERNPDLNAVVTIDEEGARAEAKAADEALDRGERWGPLHGVPMTVKDVLETAGMRTTGGFPHLADHVPETDATVVERLREAGAVIVGKTNLPTVAMGYHSENPIFGRTVNPWDPSRVPGGSSGGAAAAVAAEMTPLEVGSDIGGSIRIPAHYCGIYGIKPTEHLIPLTGHIPEPPEAPRGVRHMAVVGPIARSVGDLTLALELLAGPDGRRWETPPVQVARAPRPDLGDLGLAWTDDFAGLPVTGDTADALDALANRLRASGCAVERAVPDGFDMNEAWRTWGELSMAEIGATMPTEEREGFVATFAASDDPLARGMVRGNDATVAQHVVTLERRDKLIAALEGFLDGWDAWICPVAPTPAVPHHEPGDPVDVDGQTLPYLMGGLGHCTPFNLTGNPAVTIPIGRSADGLPIGCQIVGRRWDDMRLLAVAETVTEVVGTFPPPGPSDVSR